MKERTNIDTSMPISGIRSSEFDTDTLYEFKVYSRLYSFYSVGPIEGKDKNNMRGQ
jgi:hypothetical protein